MNIILKPLDTNTLAKYFQKNEGFVTPLILQYADFNVINYLYENKFSEQELSLFTFYPDSTAVHLYLKYIKSLNARKIVSTDLQESLLLLAHQNNAHVYLLGGTNNTLEKASKAILSKYNNICLCGYSKGYKFDSSEVIFQINSANAFLVLVGLGNGRQEKWILKNHKKLNSKMIISVGGWFEFLATPQKRAPLFLRKLSLEWLFKLIVEFPRVWRRYFLGIPKFYYRALTKKIVLDYRCNESSIL